MKCKLVGRSAQLAGCTVKRARVLAAGPDTLPELEVEFK
jgi:hypothetical protein